MNSAHTPTKSSRASIDQRRHALKALLVSQGPVAGTRLGACTDRQAPCDGAKLALLLMIFGYKVRLSGDTVAVFATAWVPALAPRVGETVLVYLNKQCSLMPPAGLMDANDDRLASVFEPLTRGDAPDHLGRCAHAHGRPLRAQA